MGLISRYSLQIPLDIVVFIWLSASMANSLTYRRLDMARNEIRLLKLLPPANGNSSADVHVVLEYASLSNPRPYVALSYHWGDVKDTVSIEVDSQPFSATRNLANALRNLRGRGQQYIWVDAICINQSDKQEHGDQINRMAAIYQCAKNVYAWLGEDLEVQEKALPMIEHIFRTMPTGIDKFIDTSFGGFNKCFTFKGFGDVDAWRAVTKLFINPYWSRVWIIQELAFSKEDVQLICGTKTMPFSHLIRTVNLLKKFKIEHFEGSSYLSHIDHIHRIRSRLEAGEPISLVEAMIRSSKSESSEKLDRIYALLGLVSSSL